MEEKFVYSVEEVAALKRVENLSDREPLNSLVARAALLARPPISQFQVGAAGLAASGAVYLGINLEFPGTPIGNSVHAEQFLVVNALRHGETELRVIAVNAVPCGHCRQFLAELHNADTLRIVLTKGAVREWGLAELLPMRFTPQDVLGESYSAVLMAPREKLCLTWTEAAQELIQHSSHIPLFAKAAEEAKREACQSYAPYSQCPSGVSLVTKQSGICIGSCIESCAYNPTLPPLQSAIIHAISLNKLHSYTDIALVVLAELEGPPDASYAESTKALIQAIAPGADFVKLSLETLF